MKNQLSLNLDADRFDHANNRESLGELLKQAVDISFPNAEDAGDLRNEMRWIARWSIRAVSEEIVRSGGMTLPCAVRFHHRTETETPPPSKIIQFDPAA